MADKIIDVQPTDKNQIKYLNASKKTKPKSTLKKMGHSLTFDLNGRIIVLSSLRKSDKSQNANARRQVEKLTDLSGNEVSGVYGVEEKLLKTDIDAKSIEYSGKYSDSESGREYNKTIVEKNKANDKRSVKKDYLDVHKTLYNKYFSSANIEKSDLYSIIADDILSVNKILVTHINSIINTFISIAGNGEIDVIGGSVSTNFDWNEFNADPTKTDKVEIVKDFLRKIEWRFTYFDGVFKRCRINDDINEIDYYNYDTLRLLSLGRQCVVHNKPRGKGFDDATLYHLSTFFDAVKDNKKLYNRFTELYKNIAENLDDSFAKNSSTNCYILKQVYKECDEKEIVRDYYEYAIIKPDNAQISVNRLKRIIIEKEWATQLAMRDNNTNKRFQSLFNFVLWKFIRNLSDKEKIELVQKTCSFDPSGNMGKDDYYRNEIYPYIKTLPGYNTLKNKLCTLRSTCLANVRPISENTFEIPSGYLPESKVSNGVVRGNIENNEIKENVRLFAEYILFLCTFLNAKESNVLCADLINKFENIAELVSVANAYAGAKVEFKNEYAIFGYATEVEKALRVVCSIKNMVKRSRINDKVVDDNKRINVNRKMIENAVKSLISADDSFENYEHFFEKSDSLEDMVKAKNKAVFNYITNSVIRSKWFLYISAYCKPSDCAKLTHNAALVRLVLYSLQESQIIKYYERVSGEVHSSLKKEEMAERLVEEIVNLSVNDAFLQIAQNNSIHKSERKAELKAKADIKKILKGTIECSTSLYMIRDCIQRLNKLRQGDGLSDKVKNIISEVVNLAQNAASDSGTVQKINKVIMRLDNDETAVLCSRKDSVIQLYLTVAYLITKKLVEVNERFLRAFACLENDTALKKSDIKGETYFYKDEDILYLSKHFIVKDKEIEEEYSKEKRRRIYPDMSAAEKQKIFDELNAKYKQKHYALPVSHVKKSHDGKKSSACVGMLYENLLKYCALDQSKAMQERYESSIYSYYKNKVDHLNVLWKVPEYIKDAKCESFYGVYCYTLQRMISANMIEKGNEELKKPSVESKKAGEDLKKWGEELKRDLDKYAGYQRNAMWWINLPFAYNLPRYKNLSDESLFYDLEYDNKNNE